MANRYFVLNERDRNLLKMWMRRLRGNPLNPLEKSPEDVGMSLREVFVAQSSEEIPAADSTGGALGLADEVTIYRIVPDESGDPVGEDAGITVRSLMNLSPEPIPADTPFLVITTNYGEPLAIPVVPPPGPKRATVDENWDASGNGKISISGVGTGLPVSNANLPQTITIPQGTHLWVILCTDGTEDPGTYLVLAFMPQLATLQTDTTVDEENFYLEKSTQQFLVPLALGEADSSVVDAGYNCDGEGGA